MANSAGGHASAREGIRCGAALIAADGIRSAIREQLLGDAPRYAGYSGWRGLATMDTPPLEPGFGRQVGGRGIRRE